MITAEGIPIIDIAPLREAGGLNVKETATQIHEACSIHGFFYITGHGVSTELQDKLERTSQLFFDLSKEEKMKISMEKGGKAWRGFFPVGDELTSGQPDQKEGIYFGTELSENHPKVQENIALHGKNLFPQEPDELQNLVLEYMNEITDVAHTVMRGIALSLNLPASYFNLRYTSDPFILFRIFHYPAQTKSRKKNWGVGEHTDYGLLTILKQDRNGGLQVKSGAKWIDAPPIPNTFVCNIGDMLDRMTAGLYKSTLHRVRNTSGKNRLSFPLFFDPNFDAHVKPIEGLAPHSTEPVTRWDNADVYDFEGTYGEYLIKKVSKVFPNLFDTLK